MSGINEGATNTTDREIVITRTFDAPRELVWQAWINPRQDPAHQAVCKLFK
jgi:hypothetical protein